MIKSSLCFLLFSLVTVPFVSHGAVETDCTSNEVFDIYYFGNGDIGQMGSLSNFINPKTGMDTQQMAGYVDWSETNKTNYWSQDESLKKMAVQAVNTWTDAITNRLDMDKHARKLRVGFFLDDSSWSGSTMGYAYGYSRYYSVQTNFEKDSSYNSYSIVEWTLLNNYETDYYKNPASSFARDTNLLLSAPQNIDVAVFVNPDTVGDKANLLKVATHELGHAMGFDSKLYKLDTASTAKPGDTVLSKNMTRWDSLLTLDGVPVAEVRSKEGYPNIKEATSQFGSLDALHEAAWNPDMKDGDIQYDPERRLSLELGKDKTGVYVSALSIMGNTLVHLSNPEDWVDGYSFDVMGAGGLNASVLSENDLDALRMLGYTLSVPEPSSCVLVMAAALAGCCMRFRRK